MKHLIILLCLFVISSCDFDYNSPAKNRGAAELHKDLYTINHNLLQTLSSTPLTRTDSSYLKLSEYLDVVVLALINESGGQKSEDGTLIYPNDTTRWIQALETIDFQTTWKRGTELNAELQDLGLKKVTKAVDRRMTLEWVCIELRILQTTVLEKWVSVSKTDLRNEKNTNANTK